MLILGKARAKDGSKGYATTLPAAPRRGARAPRRERDPARRQRRRTQPRRAGRGHPRADRAPRSRPAGLPRRGRRRLRPPRRSAAGRPLAAAPDQRRTAVVLAASAADRQRLPGRIRHRARPASTAPTSSSPAASPTPRWSSVPPPGGGAGRRTTTTPSPARSCAGHVIECGPQATGGNFSGFRAIPDLVEPGFPIAEIAADGSSVITKNPGTGGAVTPDTVTAQLVYEIGEPAYLNPDVITHLDTAQLTDLGEDRVQIRGVRGSAPPATTKVAITGVGGWENSVIFALTGDRSRREGRPRRAIRPPRHRRPSTGSTRSRSTGSGRRSTIPTARTPEPSCSRSRCREPSRPPGAPSPSRMVELALSSYPGLYALGPPQPGSAFGVYWPALLDQAVLEHTVHHHDGTTETIAPGSPRGAGRAVRPAAEPRRAIGATAMDRRRTRRRLARRDRARPLRRQGRRREPRRLGTRPASVGLAPVDPHRRRTPTPPPRNPRPGDLTLRAPQPRRGELRPPRTARDRRHLDAAAGRTGKGTRRMAARTQHQGARLAGQGRSNRRTDRYSVREGALAHETTARVTCCSSWPPS